MGGCIRIDSGKPADFFFTTESFVTALAGQLRVVLSVLFVAVGFVLLIACANVASLQLVHVTARTRELSVRAALGAGHAALVRQLIVENLILSTGGGVLGLALGQLILGVARQFGAAQLPALANTHLSGTVLGFTAAATITSGFLFGVLPAVRGGRVDLQTALRSTGLNASASRSARHLLQSAVVGQLALTLVLLLGSGLMIRTLSRLLAENPGFTTQHITTVRVSASVTTYPAGPALTSFWKDVLGRIAAIPGISQVGLTTDLPFSDTNDSNPFQIVGRDPDPGAPAMHSNLHTASSGFFTAMGIPLLRGRLFDQTDTKLSANVVIIDSTLARTYFSNESPIGRQIDQGAQATIIGVVGTVDQQAIGERPKATTYYPPTQHDWYRNMYVVVRSALPSGVVGRRVRESVASIDPRVPVYDERTLAERIDNSLAPRRLAMAALSGLAILSLLLATFGLYGVISYTVSERATELGIRMALGAQAADVQHMVVRQGALLAAGGIAVGLAASFIATRALGALLFGVSSHDPVTFATAGMLLALIAIGACYLPARRATRISPLGVLRGS